MRRKVIKAVEEGEELEWEMDEKSGGQSRQQLPDGFIPILVGGSAVLILIAGVVAFMVLKQDRLERERVVREHGRMLRVPVNPGNPEPEVAPPEEDARVELPMLEERVREFLAAETVDEVLSLIRGGAQLQGMIRDYYSRHPLEPVIPRKIAPSGKVLKSEGLWAVDVRLPDFSIKPIALERIEGVYMVDWASWVGYSELPWEQVTEVRPSESVLFRVICSPVNYYNFGFSDDRKWQAYRLQSPDRKHTLYGYVERNSIPAGMLPKTRTASIGDAFLLQFRFTENSGPDQVLIEEVVSSGWVLRELDKAVPKE